MGKVTMYSCGPTVYDYQHIGNMRKYVGDDILVRVLKYLKFRVKRVMNITDVGHLTSDEDSGIDKMEKGAKKFGLSVWEIAKKFEAQFWDSFDKTGNLRPDLVMHATDFVKEQIDLIKILEKKGYTYIIDDGVYFDTAKFKDYFKFAKIDLKSLKKGARVEFAQDKKNISDFALWKFSYLKGKTREEFIRSIQSDNLPPARQMEWNSPWGIGFPGWHIECSAMSMQALGETLDIHTGGIEHIPIHHTNEIAQSECATGKEFVRYWLHYNHLLVDNCKMSKSLGNVFTIADLIAKNYAPIALRYFFLQAHYRQEQNFTWKALDAAQTASEKLTREIAKINATVKSKVMKQSSKKTSKITGSNEFLSEFESALCDDLNTPRALAIVWKTVRSNLDQNEKLRFLKIMNNVLGLKLFEKPKGKINIAEKMPEKILNLANKREKYRENKDFKKADEIREIILKLGFTLIDNKRGFEIKRK